MEKNKGHWNPYLAGAMSGVVIVLSVWLVGKYAGASTSFVRSAGMLEQLFAPERVAQMQYFIKTSPIIEWQWMFVAGILVGALLAALTSGTFKMQAVPTMWQQRFGKGISKRAIVAFSGGLIAMFGARLAGGCPSGHGLSGSMQLAVSGFIAMICFFIAGIIVARIVYGPEEKR